MQAPAPSGYGTKKNYRSLSRRLENNAKREARAEAKANPNAFVSPVGLYGNNTFVENIGSNQNKMSSPPPLPRRRSYPQNQGAAAAAAFAANLNAAAAPPVVPFSFAAPSAVPQFSSSLRGTNLERANAENQVPRKQFVVAPVVPAPEAPEDPENAAREGALRGVRTSTVNNNPTVSNAVVAAQLERNSLSNQNARIAAKQRVERYKLGLLPGQRALRISAAANAAAAAAAAAAHEAAFVKSAEGPDVYGCTPCDRKILEKLDTLLDRSKPSNVLGALKGTGAFVVTQVGAALSDAVAALKLAQEKGSKKARKVAEDALKYVQKKLGQLLKALTLSDETKKKIAEALENVNKALKLLYDNKETILGVLTAPIWGPIVVAVIAAEQIIEGLSIVGSATYNYLKTVVVPAATQAWSSAKTKILTALGLAASWMNSTRKAIGIRLYNFGTRVSGAAKAAFSAMGRGAGAVSRAMYRLSGREQADMIKLLVQKVTSLELQGRITGKALQELNAAIAAAKPGVVTADVAAEAAKVGASPALLTNAAAVPRLTNGSRGSLAEVERRYPPLAESPIQVLGEEAPRPLQTRGVAAPPGAPLIEGMNGGRKRSRKSSRKNRKSSRKNRKASRKNRK
jgi:tetratricopeptide (TPR) repeat protein